MRKIKGFSLLEVLIAIFILALVSLAAFGTLATSIFQERKGRERFLAAYLAQEGIEIVKNIRDSNVIKGVNWRTGLNDGVWQADYKSQTLSSYTGAYLKFDPQEGYNLSVGTQTQFQRQIKIETLAPDKIKITVTIFWSGQQFQLISLLTQWY